VCFPGFVPPFREASPEGDAQKKPAPKGEDTPIEEEHHALVCRICEVEITEEEALFCMRSGSVEQVFPNPYGHMRVILTAKHARSVEPAGDPTTEFTWFAGYAWTVLSCANCRAHLGWVYDAVGADQPARFYGLLKEALTSKPGSR